MSHKPTSTIRVLGVDPGTRITGFGVVGKKGTHLTHVDSGVVKLPAAQPLSEKLLAIHLHLLAQIELHKPDALAIEAAFFAKNVRSAMVLAHARGTILMTAAQAGIPIFEYSALEVKQASVGYGRATKEQVFDMVMRLLNLQKTQIQSMDQTDALSCAICHLNRFDLEQKVQAGNQVGARIKRQHRT
jgi:crossover junction endodeoxyribonuclease RuvC